MSDNKVKLPTCLLSYTFDSCITKASAKSAGKVVKRKPQIIKKKKHKK